MAIKKLTIKLVDLYSVFLHLTETEKANKSFPFKLAWQVADIKAVLLKHAQRVEEERNKIFEQYGEQETDKPPGNFKVKVENIEKVNIAIKELNETEVEVEFNPIPISLLEAFKDLQFAAGAFEVLRKDFIEFPEEVKV